MKEELTRPFVIGTTTDYGGILSVQGLELVKAMHKSVRFEVNVLNLKTGEVTPFDPDQTRALRPTETLLIEHETVKFPFFHKTWNCYIFEEDTV